jgi:predicted RNA-binding protein YlqC (UPF0109 family)
MSTGVKVPADVQKLADWFERLCAFLCDPVHRDEVEVHPRPGPCPGEWVFIVVVPDDAFGGLVGQRGTGADALRTILRMRKHAEGQHGLRLDARIRLESAGAVE